MRILVVDDSKVMRSIIIRKLRQAGFDGHSMDEASDGKSALDAIDAARPDLVLTDWNMPGMSGLDLLRTVRAAGDETPFIFITSEGTDEMRALALHSGARDLITKPFTAEGFQVALGDVIR